MGYLLRRMIRDGAPPGWSPLMRLVAGEIADDARDAEAKPGVLAAAEDWPRPLPYSRMPIEGEYRHGEWKNGLAEACGMSGRAVSRVLAELAEHGYDMRAPITDRYGKPVRDKRGRLVYAAKGHAVSFIVPPLAPRSEPRRSPDSASNDGQAISLDEWDCSPEVASIESQRSPLLVPMVAESGDPVPSGPPNIKTVPPAAAPRLAEDQERSATNSQNRRVRHGSETMADDAQQFPLHDAESTTAGTGTRASRSGASAA